MCPSMQHLQVILEGFFFFAGRYQGTRYFLPKNARTLSIPLVSCVNVVNVYY